MKKLVTFLFTSLFAFNLINAQRLTVGNPHEEWWYYNQGSIEDAEITIHPQGLYLEVGMYLTFSGKEHYYSSQDTIELACEFNLPEGSIVHDSWLWLNQDTLIADLIDRWTATSIYNAIVGRRQDPSILYKTWGNNYELRIYPMQGDSTRRVKVSYLVPMTFTSTTVFASLPMNIVKLSMSEVEHVKFRVQTDDVWKNPRIMEYPELAFSDDESEAFLTNKLLDINSANYNFPFTIQFDSPMKDGIFINNLDDEEDYYQLAILPSTFIKNIEPKNVMVCVDYIEGYYWNEPDEVLSDLKYSLKNGLSPIDSFNLMFSSSTIKPICESWVSVGSIDSVFDSFTENPINNDSYLPSLLIEAIEFVNKGSSAGEVMLIANSDEDGNPETANALIDTLIDVMGDDLIPVHCANYNRYSSYWYWAGSNYYRGNEYLYINLTRLTNANYSQLRYWSQSFKQFLFEFTQTIDGFISSFDLYTSVEDGFCYSRLDLNQTSDLLYVNKPFMQVGKYYGNLPFKIEIAGLYNETPFSESITINEDDIIENDTLLEEIWAGNYINSLENQTNWYSNEIVREIIDYSIQERVLSVYTAFLAIEPGALDSINIDIVDNDGDVVVAIKEPEPVEEKSEEIYAYPNPFLSDVSFEINISKTSKSNQLMVKIFDVSGKLIFNDAINNVKADKTLQYNWQGTDNAGDIVPQGTYVAVFYAENYKEVIKLLKM